MHASFLPLLMYTFGCLPPRTFLFDYDWAQLKKKKVNISAEELIFVKKFQVTRVHEEFFLPGEVIMEQGHVVDQLYFVCDGVLVIVLRYYCCSVLSTFYHGLLFYNKLIVICGLENVFPALY